MKRDCFASSRRQFFGRASAAAILAAHDVSATPLLAQGASGDARPANGPRILSLELQCGVALARMKEFYERSLGLRVMEDRADRLTVAAGATRLTFVSGGSQRQPPFYHFAFNIPENKIRAARDWQRKRSALLPIPARLRDTAYPDDVVNYSHWNAHSVFVFDPAGNVVEYIARHDLRNAAPGAFASRDILYASEIAFVVDDVTAAAASLREFAGMGAYRGGNDEFRALGDEAGLLLVMRRGRVISFDAPERKAVSVFRTSVRLGGQRAATHRMPGFPYEIGMET